MIMTFLINKNAIKKAKDAIVLGTETEYLVYEESKLLNSIGKPLLRPVTYETLVNLLRCIPPEIGDPLNNNGFISNGGRIYVDTPFVEYTTPECLSLRDLILYEKIGDHILNSAAKSFLDQTGRKLDILKMIRSQERNSGEEVPGYHENYGLRQDRYFKIFMQNFYPKKCVFNVLIPFLVTRQIYAGAGSFMTSSKRVDFQLSQRAQWIDTVVNYTSSYRRPILHLKRPNLDETHLRIHITCGDPNKAAGATFLKIGTTAIVFACISQGTLNDLNLEMVDPVAAFQSISARPTMLVPLTRGDHLSALNIQLILLDKIQKLENTIIKTEYLEWNDIIKRWESVLKKLRRGFLGPVEYPGHP